MYVINVYRYPNGSIKTFLDELDRIITMIYSEEAEARIIIVGDFNIDLLKNDAKAKKIESFDRNGIWIPLMTANQPFVEQQE